MRPRHFALVLATACGVHGSIPAGEKLSLTIGPDGGQLSLASGAVLTVPPNALATPTLLTLEVQPVGVATPGVTPLGAVYHASPDGTHFALPVTLSLPIPAGVTGALAIFMRSPGASRFAVLATKAQGAAAITSTTHFTEFVLGSPAGLPAFTTAAALPDATVGERYVEPLGANGAAPLQWDLPAGESLAPGLALDGIAGQLNGTPTQAGTFAFFLEVSDARGVAQQVFTLTVARAADPVPSLASIAPTVAPPGADVTLALTGTGFADDSQVAFDGALVTTQFVSATTLNAALPAAMMLAGMHQLTVESPAPGGGRSEPATLVVGAAPGPPTSVMATPGDGSAAVSWTAPADTGGLPIASYTVTVYPGSATTMATNIVTTITGLTNGTAYVFHVVATNAAGDSASASSGPVTPHKP